MEMVTRGPVSAAPLVWRRGSEWVLTVICKATLDIVPGEARVRDDPPPPLDQDVSWERRQSLRAAGDLVPVKPKVDVVLSGHAYAPFRSPVKYLLVRLGVGPLEKAIDVWADRCFDKTGALQVGQPFAQMPLVYERAAGGPRTWNPVGVLVGVRDANGNLPLPNLQPARFQLPPLEKLFMPPVGLGPIPAHWPSRAQSLGNRALRDLPVQWNGETVPDDIALEYFNSAPLDQQMDALPEGETLRLENLHPEHPNLQCKLPALRPVATYAVGSLSLPVALRADTLHLDTDRALCTIVWRGSITVRDPRESGRVTVQLDAPRAAPRPTSFTGGAAPAAQGGMAAAATKMGAPSLDPPVDGTMTLAPIPGAGMMNNPHPFAKQPSPPAPQGQPPVPRPSQPQGQPSLSQSSTSWADVRAASPVVPASPAWDSEATLPPMPSSPRATEPEGPPRPVTDPLPPPVFPDMTAPAPQAFAALGVVPAVVVSAGVVDSRWTSPEAGPQRETIGMQVVSGSLAISDPKYDPLPGRGLEPTPGAAESVQLLWLDMESVARIRKVPEWRERLSDLRSGPLDRDLDGSSAREPWEIEDRREVFEVLVQCDRTDASGVKEALAGARRPDGRLLPPLVLVEGDLEIQLDELACLKASASAATPLVTPTDEGLRAAVTSADAFLNRPGLMTTPSMCEGLTARIREAFVREKKALPADYLDRQMEQAALMGRCYQKRRVLGGAYLRALLWIPGEKEGILVYVPEAAEVELPMYRRWPARLIGDVHPQVDQYETKGMAIRALALSRRA